MVTLLKGHTHLQAEFWVFFDDLRPPPACPGQFEEAHWPEEGVCGLDSGDAVVPVSGGGASGGFEEVTLPELEEEEEGHKIQPATSQRQRRKMAAHKNYKVNKAFSIILTHSLCSDHMYVSRTVIGWIKTGPVTTQRSADTRGKGALVVMATRSVLHFSSWTCTMKLVQHIQDLFIQLNLTIKLAN